MTDQTSVAPSMSSLTDLCLRFVVLKMSSPGACCAVDCFPLHLTKSSCTTSSEPGVDTTLVRVDVGARLSLLSADVDPALALHMEVFQPSNPLSDEAH